MWLLYNLVNLVFDVLTLAIIARAFISWFNVSPYHPVVRLLYQITEPILAPLRRYIPPVGMMDITPIVALILLQVIQRVILTLLFSL